MTTRNNTRHPNVEGQNCQNFIVSLKTEDGHHHKVHQTTSDILLVHIVIDRHWMYPHVLTKVLARDLMLLDPMHTATQILIRLPKLNPAFISPKSFCLVGKWFYRSGHLQSILASKNYRFINMLWKLLEKFFIRAQFTHQTNTYWGGSNLQLLHFGYHKFSPPKGDTWW